MSSDKQSSIDLVSGLTGLGRKDREAILQKLSPEQRSLIQQTLLQRSEEEAAETDRQQQIDRQFLGYSPWLAALVQKVENHQPEALTSVAASTVWEVHSELLATRSSIIRSGWLGFVDQITDVFALPRKGKS